MGHECLTPPQQQRMHSVLARMVSSVTTPWGNSMKMITRCLAVMLFAGPMVAGADSVTYTESKQPCVHGQPVGYSRLRRNRLWIWISATKRLRFFFNLEWRRRPLL
jgi:hypothetical protein